jgi:ATP-dependent RNA helicase HelY
MQDAERLVAEFEAALPFALDPFQREAMIALAAGNSVLVAAPTGTGKTVVAEFGVHLARARGQRALYTTPIKALSNQKYRDFREQYGDAVGLLTGDLVVEPDAAVQVMTTEVLRNRLVQGTDALDDVGAIVFDEVHYMGDPERGTAWEESILLAPRHVPLICLSATVPNTEEIASWLRDVHGDLSCIFHDERAVPLEVQYFLDGRGQLVLDADGERHAWFPDVGGELGARIRYGGHGEGNGEREPHPMAPPWQVVRYLESQELTPAIYFLFGRRACEEAAASCLGLKPVPHAEALVQEARARLAVLPPEDRNLRQVALLFRLLPRGVAVHHAGLLPPIKLLVEELFATGRLRAVFATDTLALGINMPARTVVVGEMTKWDGEQRRLLTPNEFRQMAGRAGRRGLDARGVALVLYSPWVTFERSMDIANGELLPLRSAFRPSYSTTINLWHGPDDEERLAELYARSLRRFQGDQRLHHLAEVREGLHTQFEALQEGDPRDPAVWAAARNLSRAEHALNRAHAMAGREARTMVEGLARVLERFGYLNQGRPTWKAAYLRRLFGNNALTLAELLAGRYLEPLEAAEVAEVASWFSWDRDTPLHGLPIPTRLYRLRTDLRGLHGSVLAEEARQGVEASQPLYEEFHGVGLAWAQGWTLKEIAVRTRIAEGDLVGHFQKTLDLLGQLRNAAKQAQAAPTTGPARGTRRAAARGAASEVQTELLLERLNQADELLRRGVVAASYQWAVEGPPDAQAIADADWVPPPLDDDEAGGRRGRGRSPYPDGTGRSRTGRGRGNPARRAAKGPSGHEGKAAEKPAASGGRALTWQRPSAGDGKPGASGGGAKQSGRGTAGGRGAASSGGQARGSTAGGRPARGKPARRRRGR